MIRPQAQTLHRARRSRGEGWRDEFSTFKHFVSQSQASTTAVAAYFPSEASFFSDSACCPARMSARGSVTPSAIFPLPMSLKSEAGLAFRPRWAVTVSKRSNNFRRAVEIVNIGGAISIRRFRVWGSETRKRLHLLWKEVRPELRAGVLALRQQPHTTRRNSSRCGAAPKCDRRKAQKKTTRYRAA
jgi:hypothetical protein